MATIRLNHLSKQFEKTEVLRDISLEVQESEFIVFVGPSGCGKSTLLRIIAGFESPTSGEVIIDGRVVTDTPPNQRGIAMVFQNYALYPHMTAADNIGFALRNLKTAESEVRARVAAIADLLQITPLLGRRPHEMSGGERQRVAIGRALVRDPKVFLFDEPLSNLDAALRMQLRADLARLHQRLTASMVYVTHDQTEAMTLADRMVILNNGRIEQIGPPLDAYRQPKTIFVAGFLGAPAMNLLPGVVLAIRGRQVDVQLIDGSIVRVNADTHTLSVGAAVTIGIRPEHLQLSRTHQQMIGRIGIVEHLGNRTLIYVRLHGSTHQADTATPEVIVELGGTTDMSTKEEAPAPGDLIYLTAPEDAFHLFDDSGHSRAVHQALTPTLHN